MRTIETHKINPANDKIDIQVLDEPGPGGANHDYRLQWNDGPHGACVLHFQKGPISEEGVNGVSHEALLVVLIDRLECFQKGEYACKENDVAIHYLDQAKRALFSRTKNRMERGVEGTSQK